MQDKQSRNANDSSGKISCTFHTPDLATVIINPPAPLSSNFWSSRFWEVTNSPRCCAGQGARLGGDRYW